MSMAENNLNNFSGSSSPVSSTGTCKFSNRNLTLSADVQDTLYMNVTAVGFGTNLV